MSIRDQAQQHNRQKQHASEQTRRAVTGTGMPADPIKVPEGGNWIGAENVELPDEDGVVPNEGTWEALPAIDYTRSSIPVTPIDAPLAQRWQAVMAEVQEIRKSQQFSGGGVRYAYRGVDAVVNAVGPALRKHYVMIMPRAIEAKYRDVMVGKAGTPMRECTVIVTYDIRGTTDEFWVVTGAGESLDSGDKGTTKACTVAYRNMLLTALSVPVDNPRLDADAQEYHRGQQPTGLPSPQRLRDEALHKNTSYERLAEIFSHINPRDENARFRRLGHEVVQNEFGEDERLAALVWRRGHEHPDAPKQEGTPT
jgi:hypothetical protein